MCIDPAYNIDPYTDHSRMEIILSVPTTTHVPTLSQSIPRSTGKRKLDFSSLHSDTSLQDELRSAIDNKLKVNLASCIETEFLIPTVEEATKVLNNAIREACEEVVPHITKTRKTRDWYQDNKGEMELLINNKQRSWAVYIRKKRAAAKGKTVFVLPGLFADVQRTRKAVITEGFRLRNAFWTKIARDMDSLFLKNAWGPLTQKIKAVYGPEKLSYKSGKCSQLGMIRKSDGTETQSPQEVNDRFFEHFKNLLNQGSNVPTSTWNKILPQSKPPVLELALPFTIEECRIALKQCPNNKAPGLSGIPIESLKCGSSDTSLQYCCNRFNSMLSGGHVPESIKEVKVTPIYKSGSRDVCDNYRGISLMEHQLKWLERLILNRIQPFAENEINDMIPDTQWGFGRDRSAVDAIMINRLLTTSALARSTHIYKCFVDLSKAYDRVDRPLLWELLRRHGIPPNIVRLLENLHTDSFAVVITPGHQQPSERFLLKHGLKQGSVLAPLLFNIFSGAMMRRTKE